MIKDREDIDSRKVYVLRWMIILSLISLIFIIDTATDFEIAAAVLYVVVVLLAAKFLPVRVVLAIAGSCILLTVVSLLITPTGDFRAGSINCLLSIIAIGATTYLALKRSNAILAEAETRSQLVHLARVNALGEMTASIAHEVNQPLTGIITSGQAGLNWLALETPNLDKARQALKRMIGDAERASGIIARVRKLSRRAEPKTEWLDVQALIEEALAVCKLEIDRHDIIARALPCHDVLVINADAVQIQQVLLNMVINAIESIAGRTEQDGEIELRAQLFDDRHVEIVVSDNGVGIDKQIAARLFDAFYTSKPRGIGLGLTISRSIVETHGGKIWAAPRAGGGASFHFTLSGRQLQVPK